MYKELQSFYSHGPQMKLLHTCVQKCALWGGGELHGDDITGWEINKKMTLA